jgi:tetratricopeptide (TPR) repeat protein
MRIHAGILLAALLMGAFCATLFAQETPPLVPRDPPAPPAWLAGYKYRYPVRVLGKVADFKTQQSILLRLPTGGWLMPDGGDVAITTTAGAAIPVTVISHDPAGETIIQFKRNGNDEWYWAYAGGAVSAKAEAIKEGLTCEVRQWEGENFKNWEAVVGGLEKSDNVIGNAIVADVVQNTNPVRFDQPRNFATSYRGYLNIVKPGVYRFFVNAEDASFLFIDGFKLQDRGGNNTTMHLSFKRDKEKGIDEAAKFGAEIELAAGVHTFEIHQVVGNSPSARGVLTMIWLTPEPNSNWGWVPSSAFVSSLVAEAGNAVDASGAPALSFSWGMDDVLNSGGVTLYLARFDARAVGITDNDVTWDFGDGTTGKGLTARHVYFKTGDYKVAVKSANGVIFKRNCYVWPVAVKNSPLTLLRIIRACESLDWKTYGPARVSQLFEYLLVCQQPERYPLLEGVSNYLLELPDLDPQMRAIAWASRLEAMAAQGRGRDAIKLLDKGLDQLAKQPSLRVLIQMKAAEVYVRFMKEPELGLKLLGDVIVENQRTQNPLVRQAAVMLGDLLAESGRLAAADDAYHLAQRLGSREEEAPDATKRGAMLRVAEQKLRAGDIRVTRQMLEQIETESPDQKIKPLYRFLRAETDRMSGRYEDALENYGIVATMTEWAGFRDKVEVGIADCYFRMGEYDLAIKRIEEIKRVFPKAYADRKLDTYRKMLLKRKAMLDTAMTQPGVVAKVAATPADDKKNINRAIIRAAADSINFRGATENFEGKTPVIATSLLNAVWASCAGMGGARGLGIEPMPVPFASGDYSAKVENVQSNCVYWMEFWYKEVAGPLGGAAAGGASPHARIDLRGISEGQVVRGELGNVLLERTFGQWRKVGFATTIPVADMAYYELQFVMPSGYLLIDNVSIERVADRQVDSLNNFVEGKGSE